ncbi:Retrovirus-related Pol polyprotein from transposon RE1 [Sesamum angolense]|uniref:Retrovirus-related Pol polyprotein from transposon RE1 n=1 Tax=Sesamum angolense TaxID=2727404 RepID=A0AAE2BTE8_9LAMI|nr:Retrovirus-related Pol polyprotein from transposon RE1 [Sesamum angolense]
MKAELTALEDNNTWEVVPLPQWTNAIGCRWVYKLKLRADRSVDTYKARLLANECFSPVAKVVTVRLFLVISAIFNWHIHRLDVNNAFLHGYLDEDIFMEAPEGFHVPTGHVCKLKRSLYGLKQASRQWNQEFTSKIASFGFIQSKHDYCLFTKHSGSDFLVLLLYVDDILLAGSSTDMITEVNVFLDKLFTIKDLGTAKYFLGLEIARSSQGIIVTQATYTKDIVLDVGLEHARSTTTPLPPGIKFSCDAGARLNSPESYRRLVGRLLYLNFTRPDISHATQQLSQFLQSPCQQHWDAALHLVRYLKGSLNKGLFYSAHSPLTLKAYSDVDWASCVDSLRSLTSYCIFLGGSLVSWKTKKQNTVSRSTVEAEYRSMGITVCELAWIVYLLRDFGVQIPTPILFLCDSQAVLHIVANPVFHERTKHLEIDCHLVRDKFRERLIAPSHVSSRDQLADIFTKPLVVPLFLSLLSKLALIDFVANPACGGGVVRTHDCAYSMHVTSSFRVYRVILRRRQLALTEERRQRSSLSWRYQGWSIDMYFARSLGISIVFFSISASPSFVVVGAEGWHYDRNGLFSIKSAYLLTMSLSARWLVASLQEVAVMGGVFFRILGRLSRRFMRLVQSSGGWRHILAECSFPRLIWVLSQIPYSVTIRNKLSADAWLRWSYGELRKGGSFFVFLIVAYAIYELSP